MEISTIRSKVSELVCQVLETKGDIQTDGDLRRVGLDSLKTIALVVKLEEAFSINFAENELLFENFSTIEKIAERVLNKIKMDTHES